MKNKALIILLLSAALWILMLLSAAPKLITHAAGDMPTEEEIAEMESFQPSIEEQVQSLKDELKSYDYIGVKIAMGVATTDDYAEEIAYTETLRQKIRELTD